MAQREISLLKSNKQGSRSDMAARFISDLANPLFLPPIVFIFLGWQLMLSGNMLALAAAISLTFYTLIPLGIVFLLLKKGHISSLDAPERKSRNQLYLYAIISSVAGSLLLLYALQNNTPFLSKVVLVYLLNPFVALLINLKWKISIHTGSVAIAATIMCIFFMMESTYSPIEAFSFSLVMLLLLLPMIWARHHLNIHSLSELIGGAAIGILLTIVELGLIF